ncbi:hypothetical protein ACNPQM_22040 [Streptomyces sp. NPDC056231]|uniref:hypothetical protein n=1 Tax=Streptomyces sp. NPDC056231 TaxID=3345755 RepID=UPI003AB1002D
MAEPDNLARLIAAGSAIATALNMSLSYATYKRKRPSLSISCSYGTSDEQWSDRPTTVRPGVWVDLKNRGETPVAIDSVGLEFQWDKQPATWRDRLRRQHPDYVRWMITAVTPRPEDGDFPYTLNAFDDKRGFPLFVPGCVKDTTRIGPDARGRLQIALSGGRRIYTPWSPLYPKYVCACPSCWTGDEQLTFDDLE